MPSKLWWKRYFNPEVYSQPSFANLRLEEWCFKKWKFSKNLLPNHFFSARSGRCILHPFLPSPPGKKKKSKEKGGHEIQESRDLTKHRDKRDTYLAGRWMETPGRSCTGRGRQYNCQLNKVRGFWEPCLQEHETERVSGVFEHSKWRVTPLGDTLETVN